MSNETKACGCGGATRLIFPCSGAADVGAIADLAGRKLTRDGVGKMFCLAGVGGKVHNILLSTQAADTLLVIDGCPTNCAKATMDQAGITHYRHLQLADLGFQKGRSVTDGASVDRVAAKAADLLAGCGC